MTDPNKCVDTGIYYQVKNFQEQIVNPLFADTVLVSCLVISSLADGKLREVCFNYWHNFC